jgi:transposase
MRFVGVETTEQQSVMMLHRVRRILMRQSTQLSNALRSHLAEFGIVSPIGREGLDRLLKIGADTDEGRVPAEARVSPDMLAAQLEEVKAKILRMIGGSSPALEQWRLGVVCWRCPASARC